VLAAGTKADEAKPLTLPDVARHLFDGEPAGAGVVIEVDSGVRPPRPGDEPPEVVVSRSEIDGVTHYRIAPPDEPPGPDYDQRELPRFLFLGAATMTLVALLVLLKPLDRVRREGL
jgi:hypothetical protein